jgi:hypothetical protein
VNPHLVIFIKRIGITAAIGVTLYFLYILLSTYTSIDFAGIGSYIMYGFFGLTVGGMFVLVIGIMLKSVWTGILGRSETIYYCCPDKNGDGLHVISKHYFPGGETTDGYDAFYHYYIRLSDGRIHLSKKLNDEKSISRSTADLEEKHRLQLSPDLSRKTEIGHYTDSDEKTVSESFTLKAGTIDVKSFNSLLDYGFRISYMDHSKRVRWRRTI